MSKMVGRTTAKVMLDRNAYAIDATLRRKECEKQKAMIESSKQGIYDKAVRKAVQKVSEQEQSLYYSLVATMESLRKEIVELIKASLEEENENISKVDTETIRSVFKQSYWAVSKLQKMCEYEIFKSYHQQPRPTEYDKLFMDLIDTVDVRFALFATKRSLNRKTIKFHRLPDELKDEMFNRLEEFGLTQREDYVVAHVEAFKNQIKETGYSV